MLSQPVARQKAYQSRGVSGHGCHQGSGKQQCNSMYVLGPLASHGMQREDPHLHSQYHQATVTKEVQSHAARLECANRVG